MTDECLIFEGRNLCIWRLQCSFIHDDLEDGNSSELSVYSIRSCNETLANLRGMAV